MPKIPSASPNTLLLPARVPAGISWHSGQSQHPWCLLWCALVTLKCRIRTRLGLFALTALNCAFFCHLRCINSKPNWYLPTLQTAAGNKPLPVEPELKPEPISIFSQLWTFVAPMASPGTVYSHSKENSLPCEEPGGLCRRLWPPGQASTCLAQETCCDFSFISAGSKGSVGKRRLCTQRRTLQESRFCLLSHVDAALAVLQPSSIRAVTLCLLWKPRCWFSFSKQEKAWFHCFGFINSELEKSFSQL